MLGMVAFAIVSAVSLSTSIIYGEIKDKQSKAYFEKENAKAKEEQRIAMAESDLASQKMTDDMTKQAAYYNQRAMDLRSTGRRRKQ